MGTRGKIFSVPGFRAGATPAGVRYRGRLDLGLILADRACSAAGLFTTNQVKAPSVMLCKNRLRGGKARAVLVNSGNANACVGERGMADALLCAAAVAESAGCAPGRVLMNSTGVIGEPLNADRIVRAIPGLVEKAHPHGLPDFARAIMTTDTVPKLARRSLGKGPGRVNIVGVGKGAGMIMPNLATMLVYVLTDAELPAKSLKDALRSAVGDSFQALTIDGDTSTSDAVIVMAGGAARVSPARSARAMAEFSRALDDLCLELAERMAADGEGATKTFKVAVGGARTRAEADKVARRVANSLLVKTALHAGDPNWGRIMMAVGSAGAPLDPDKVGVSFVSGRSRVEVVKNGAVSPRYSEARAERILAGTGATVAINLGRGKATRTIITCDLSADYVKINAEYRT